mgnify:CR=1 FL=1
MLMNLEKEKKDVALQSKGPFAEGLDRFDSSDYTLPRVRLLQATSKEVQEGVSKPGMLVNSLTGKVYGETVEFIPFMVQKHRIRFDGLNLACRSWDCKNGIGDPGGVCEECHFAEWGRNQEAPECSLIYTYPSIIVTDDQSEETPIAISFMRTSIPAAKKLNTMLKTDFRGSVYELFSEKRENQKGKFYVFNVRKKRLLEPNERQAVLELRNLFAGKTIEVEIEDEFQNEEDDSPF